MTTNERLIRNLCRARLEELKERATAERKAIKTTVLVSDLPVKHRNLLNRLRHHAAEKQKARDALKALGYNLYDRSEYAAPQIDRPSSKVEAEQHTVNARDRTARALLEKLQSETIVATLGAPPALAQPLLQKLLVALKGL